jgi:hypothetical protein
MIVTEGNIIITDNVMHDSADKLSLLGIFKGHVGSARERPQRQGRIGDLRPTVSSAANRSRFSATSSSRPSTGMKGEDGPVIMPKRVSSTTTRT